MTKPEMPPEGIASGFTLQEVGLIAVSALLILFLLAYPRTFKTVSADSKYRLCHSRLRTIGIGMILYTNDYRFFPHMTSLTGEHTPTDISKVYRTLIHFKYLDNPETFICPASTDKPQGAGWDGKVVEPKAPKLWTWEGKLETAPVPPVLGPVGPGLADNTELSYTARRRALDGAKATSKDLLAGDKAVKTEGGETPFGNHSSKAVVVFADGHARVVGPRDTKVKPDTLNREFLMLDSRGRVIPPKPAPAATGSSSAAGARRAGAPTTGE